MAISVSMIVKNVSLCANFTIQTIQNGGGYKKKCFSSVFKAVIKHKKPYLIIV